MGSLFDKLWPFGDHDRPHRTSKPKPQPKPPAPAAPPPPIGLGTHSLEEPDLHRLRGLGVTRIRHTVYWDLWDTDEPYRVHKRERIKAAAAMGFKLLLVVHRTPADLSLDEACDQYPRLMGSLAAAFPEVEAWQLLNEEPLYPGISGSRWAAVHDQAYHAIKREAPQALVVSLGFSAEQLTSPFGLAFLARGPAMDALGLHVYNYPTVDRMRHSLPIATKAGLPVWVTEFGLCRNMVPLDRRGRWEEVQEEDLRAATLAATAAQRVYIYQYMTDEVGAYGRVEFHGIVRPNYTHRPAAAWLTRHLQAHG